MEPPADTAPAASRAAPDRAVPVSTRAFAVIGLLLIALAVTTSVAGGGTKAFRSTPFDLTINMVAAERLVDRQPLYDEEASRVQAVARSGPSMERAYTVPTNGFPGLPSTALVHAPFLVVGDEAGYAAFRWVSLLGMLAAIALVARTLPPGARAAGGLFGAGVLLLSGATLDAIDLGQGHGFLVLGFAAAIWGIANDRWKVVGIGLGVATVLKLSPAIVVAYLALRAGRSLQGRRDRRDLLVGAGATVGAMTVLAALVGRPQDLWTWATEVAPTLSGGAYQAANQSLPALVARLTSSNADLAGTQGIGTWRHLAIPIIAASLFALWRLCRNRRIDGLEVGALILVGLVAGPLTWDHYATWAVLPIVLLTDPGRWRGRSQTEVGVLAIALGLAVVLLSVSVQPPEIAAVQADAALRLTSSPYVLALLLLAAMSFRFLASAGPARADGPVAADPEPGYLGVGAGDAASTASQSVVVSSA